MLNGSREAPAQAATQGFAAPAVKSFTLDPGYSSQPMSAQSGRQAIHGRFVRRPRMRTRIGQWLLRVLLILSLTTVATAADLPLRGLAYQTWGLEAGLAQRSVEALAFDHDGFAWIGTQNGLARFDGHQFQIFRAQDVPALKSAFISRLHVDRLGRLWIGTFKNLVVYQDGAFRGITADGDEVGRVNGLAEDAAGDLYVAAEKGLYRLHDGTLHAVPGWTGPTTAALTSPEALWIAAPGRVGRLRGDERQDLPLPSKFADAVITSLAWSDDALWLATTRGLLRLRGERFEPVALEPGREPVHLQSVAAAGTTGLWAGTDKVIYRLDRGRVIERVVAQAPAVLPWPMTIQSGPTDLWFGSETDGLQHFWVSPSRLISAGDGLIEPKVWSYVQDGSRLLVGTHAGVSIIENGKARPFIPGDALPYPVAYSLLKDAESKLWVGTFAGLARFKADGTIDRTLPEFAGIQINGLEQDNRGTVWVATNQGLFRVDGDRVQPYGETMGLPKTGVRYVLHARGGEFWVGTEEGLFQQQGPAFEAVAAAGMEGVFVTSLLELDGGRLVVGTRDRGLFISGAEGWRHWGSERGLPSASAFFLAATDRWLIGAGSGVYRIPREALDQPDDSPLPVEVLIGDPGEQQAGVRIQCCSGAGNGKGILIDNAVWLPTTEGALQIQVDGPAQPPPAAYIVSLEHAKTTRAPTTEMVLDGPSRDAAIQYSAIDFKKTSRLQFRYRLNGFDQEWVDAKERRTAYYTNLPPGRFSFEIEARRPFEAWGPPVAITLEVPRTFSETWWFRSLCGLFAALLIAALVHWRLRQLQAQKLALEAIVAERTRQLAETNAHLAESNARLEDANQSLLEMSVTDTLTVLPNRRFLEKRLPMQMAQLARRRAETGRDLVIGALIIDIDWFKRVNDRYGHAVGDIVLQRAAFALRTSVRDGEYVVRWGGEEFLAIVDTIERDRLPDIAQRLHQAIARSCDGLDVGEGQVFDGITCSIGFAALPVSATTAELVWEDTLKQADHALYAAKTAGRNCWMTI